MDDQTVLAWGQPQASLVVRQGAQVGTTFTITSSEATLGREEGIEISIRDPEVSRQHARISWQSGSYHIEDLNSTNGTFLNGAMVASLQPLQSGDTIGIGQTALVFQAQAAGVPDQPTAAPAHPDPPPPSPAAPPVKQKRKGGRCLLWGCGCLVFLGLLLVIAAAVLLLSAPQELEDFLNDILNTVGLELDLAMLYVTHLLA